MVGADGALPLPWLDRALADLAARPPRGHALLLHGPRGVGQFELALLLAQSWLCEDGARADRSRGCGRCAGCRLLLARSHPDLLVLLPDALREALGWSADDQEAAEPAGESKRKPSREIRVDAVRSAIAFAQRTASRGGVRVVVVHPAETLNAIAANTLLKTLEEPPPALRFVLCSPAPQALPPTLRSRCQPWRLGAPEPAAAAAWLAAQAVPGAEVLLAATGNEPLTVLDWHRDGIAAQSWSALPAAMRCGDAGPVSRWPVPRLLEAMAKLCHDSACVSLGAPPRWFESAALQPVRDLPALLRWWRGLQRIARDAEHPWHAPLLTETLVTQAQQALA